MSGWRFVETLDTRRRLQHLREDSHHDALIQATAVHSGLKFECGLALASSHAAAASELGYLKSSTTWLALKSKGQTLIKIVAFSSAHSARWALPGRCLCTHTSPVTSFPSPYQLARRALSPVSSLQHRIASFVLSVPVTLSRLGLAFCVNPFRVSASLSAFQQLVIHIISAKGAVLSHPSHCVFRP